MKKLIIAMSMVMLPLAAPAWADQGKLSKHEWWIYSNLENFTWKEKGDTGERLLKEDGERFGLNLDYRYRAHNGQIPLRLRGGYSFGDVDYKGSTQTGEPVDSTTKYRSWYVEGDAAWRIWTKHASIDPFLGFGYRAWTRDIRDGFVIDWENMTAGTSEGYKEEWSVLYPILGLRAESNRWTNDKIGWFGEAFVRFPVKTDNDVPEFGMSVTPGKDPHFGLELGGWYDMLKLSLYYTHEKYHAGPMNGEGALQPYSESDIVGVKLGVRF